MIRTTKEERAVHSFKGRKQKVQHVSTSSSDAGGDVPGDEDYCPTPLRDGEVEDNHRARALNVESEDDFDEPPRKRFRKGRAWGGHRERRQSHGSSLCSSAIEAVAATARGRPSPYNMLSPPSSLDSFDRGDGGEAEFEEWSLKMQHCSVLS